MLSQRERDAARERWLAGLTRLERGAVDGFDSAVSGAGVRASRIVRDTLAEAEAQDDPLFALVARINRMALRIESTFNDERIVALVAGILTGMAESAYLLGVTEGRRRIKRGKPVPAAVQDEARQTIRRNAPDEAEAWTRKTGETVAKVAARHAVSDAVLGTALVGGAITSHLTTRSRLLARNIAVGVGRAGMQSSYTANGIGGWMWQAGPNACEFCWAKTGLVFPASTPFQSHINCRCSAMPSAPDAAGFSADQAFGGLTAEQQLAVLGKDRLSAWNSGEFSLRDIGDPPLPRGLERRGSLGLG